MSSIDWGLAFGIAAAVLCFAQLAYPLRRRWMARPFRNAQQALQFHVYGSALAFVFTLAHVGPRGPGGLFGWMLLIASAWTTCSGIAGVILQKALPAAAAAISSDQIPYERMPDAVRSLSGNAARIVEGTSAAIDAWYRRDAEPALSRLQPSVFYVVNREKREREALARLLRNRPALSEAEQSTGRQLQSIVECKIHLDARASFQRVLRSWPAWHVPAAVALLALIVWHVFATLYF